MYTIIKIDEESKAYLWAAILAIRNDPNSWNQEEWVTPHPCGCSYCFGGWVAQLMGIDMEKRHKLTLSSDSISALVLFLSLGNTVKDTLHDEIGLDRDLVRWITDPERSLQDITDAVLLLCHDEMPNKEIEYVSNRLSIASRVAPLPPLSVAKRAEEIINERG